MGGRPSAPAEETPAAPTVDLLEPSGSQHFHTWGLVTGTSQVHATRCALSRQICLRGTVHAGHRDAAPGRSAKGNENGVAVLRPPGESSGRRSLLQDMAGSAH